MRIFLLRHGEAEPHVQPDSARPLTARGILETEAIIERELDALRSVSSLWVSPYTRAQQTAERVIRRLPELAPQTTDLLVPEANPQRLATALEAAAVESVLLVSHQPLVGVFLDWLVGLEPGCQRLGTSALAMIETEVIAGGCGELRWVVQP
ncbi:phosphohistidine phosphatase SixA [Halioxenophilus sp. WMMB6]|uniref:phosphohistidine phosphatase SixA n=1 Tax=Halioxenophilus sp. WMMB6 TaxID=3073815 RepID=UPI00295F3FB4|nr:phosphohistidine phosphatase SixA [Halioxenophilus sp. WMMB6]